MKNIPSGFVKLDSLSIKEYREFMKYEKILYQSVDYIQGNLIDKDITIETNRTKLNLNFRGMNVPHLFGLYQPGGSSRLWADLKKHSLRVDKIYVKRDRSTLLKISAMQSIQELFEGECRLTKSGVYQKVRFERGLRTSKLILMVGFDHDGNGVAYPKTALNLKRLNVEKGEIVKTIYTQDKKTKEIKILKAVL